MLAEDCLKRIFELDKSIREDTYLLPYATVELALVAQDRGNMQLAIGFLEDAKKNFTGYMLESRLHFKIHSDLMRLTGKKSEDVLV